MHKSNVSRAKRERTQKIEKVQQLFLVFDDTVFEKQKRQRIIARANALAQTSYMSHRKTFEPAYGLLPEVY